MAVEPFAIGRTPVRPPVIPPKKQRSISLWNLSPSTKLKIKIICALNVNSPAMMVRTLDCRGCPYVHQLWKSSCLQRDTKSFYQKRLCGNVNVLCVYNSQPKMLCSYSRVVAKDVLFKERSCKFKDIFRIVTKETQP